MRAPRSSASTYLAAYLTATLLAGCASTASEPAEHTSVSSGAEAAASAETTAPDRVTGAVSWQLFEALRIDANGELHRGRTLVGTFGPNGELTTRDGVDATLQADGTLVLGSERTHFRIVDGVVYERAREVMHIEQGTLVMGGETSERIPLEGFHESRAREVLMASTLMLIGMAAAFAH